MQKTEFYQNHLDGVSRSFAFCIARLQSPLRLWVSLSYLLCRTLDTVEDSPWTDPESKERSFRHFENFLHSLPTVEQVAEWEKSIPIDIKPAERKLLQDFHELPERVKANLRRAVHNMSQGMAHFSAHSTKGNLRLKDLKEVNQYCFFVAGLVGELLTDLVSAHLPHLKWPEDIYLRAHHFGLFLQKINLLKDQGEDEKVGRYLVPDRQELLASLKKNASGAVDYILSLPVHQKDYRLFCAWSLFLGLSSLPWIQKTWMSGILNKIPRLLTEQLFTRVESIIDDNHALLAFFKENLLSVPALSTANITATQPRPAPHWFLSIYQGNLKQEHLKELEL